MAINVKLGKRSYPIVIGKNLNRELVNGLKRYSKIIIITDEKVKKLYGKKLSKSLPRCIILSVAEGEKSKSIDTIKKLCEKIFSFGIDRKACVVALGGGVVGDIAGFVSAVYMRGIDYVQVPTTLLAMVDSSIGGKTGVDLLKGKNIVGAFKQPKKVYVDLRYLESLSNEEMQNGMSEIVKAAIIGDNRLFQMIQNNLVRIMRKEDRVIAEMINRAILVKKKIVERDEFESGERMKLNFGHTIGHAIESLSGYKIKHGKAVAIGMITESRIAHKLGRLSSVEMLKINLLVRRCCLDIYEKGFKFLSNDKSLDNVIEIMTHDKKSFSGKIRLAVPVKIGKVIIVGNFRNKMIKETIKEILP
jgi:3-dehydroquinate synthase